MSQVWEPPPGVPLVAYYPGRHAVAMKCQELGQSDQWLDLMVGQEVLEERHSGLTFDLLPWADDDLEPPEPATN